MGRASKDGAAVERLQHDDAAFRWKARSQQLQESLGLLTAFPDADDSCQASALRAIDFDGCPQSIQYIVMQCFLDPWSEIRKDAFKLLKQHPCHGASTVYWFKKLFLVDLLLPLTVSGSVVEGNWAAASPVAGAATTQRIAAEKELVPTSPSAQFQQSWQSIHGRLLLLHTLLPALLDSRETVDTVFHLFLGHLKHSQELIRSAASDGIMALLHHAIPQSFPTDASIRLIITILQRLINHLKVLSDFDIIETPEFAVDGQLNLFRCLTTTSADHSTLGTSGLSLVEVLLCMIDSDSNQSAIETVVLLAFKIFSHPSSIVRQQAGQLVITLFKVCSEGAASASGTPETRKQFQAIVAFIYRDILTSSFDSIASGGSQWQHFEICLLVSEELIKYVTFRGLVTAAGNAEVTVSSQREFNTPDDHSINLSAGNGPDAQFNDFLDSVRSSLAHFILHPRYEVRRMSSQLVPALARATVLFGPGDVAIVTLPALLDTRSIRSSSEGNNSSISPPSGFDECVTFMWVAHVSKCVQHLIETLSTDSESKWIMDLAERLQEEDTKSSFHRALQAVAAASGLARDDLQERAVLYTRALRGAQEHYRIAARSDVVSCDCIAMSILTSAVIRSSAETIYRAPEGPQVQELEGAAVSPPPLTLWVKMAYLLQVCSLGSSKHLRHCKVLGLSLVPGLCHPGAELAVFPSVSDVSVGEVDCLRYRLHVDESSGEFNRWVPIRSSGAAAIDTVSHSYSGSPSKSPNSQSNAHGQWLCELLTPVLPHCSCSHNPTQSQNNHMLGLSLADWAALAVVFAQWMLVTHADRLWFDKRPHCRKLLPVNLSLVVTRLQELLQAGHWQQTIIPLNSTLGTKQPIIGFALGCLLDAISTLVDYSSQATVRADLPTMRLVVRACRVCYALSASLLSANHVADPIHRDDRLQRYFDEEIKSQLCAHMRGIKESIVSTLQTSSYTTDTAPSSSDNDKATAIPSEGDTDSVGDGDGDGDEGEFSDWDEDSSSDDGQPTSAAGQLSEEDAAVIGEMANDIDTILALK